MLKFCTTGRQRVPSNKTELDTLLAAKVECSPLRESRLSQSLLRRSGCHVLSFVVVAG